SYDGEKGVYVCMSCGALVKKDFVIDVFDQRGHVEKRVKGMLVMRFEKRKRIEDYDENELKKFFNELFPGYEDLAEEFAYQAMFVKKMMRDEKDNKHKYAQKMLKHIALATLYAYGRVEKKDLKKMARKLQINYNRFSHIFPYIDRERVIDFYTDEGIPREKIIEHLKILTPLLFNTTDEGEFDGELVVFPKEYYIERRGKKTVIIDDYFRMTIHDDIVRIKPTKKGRELPFLQKLKPLKYQAYIKLKKPLPLQILKKLKPRSLNSFAIDIDGKEYYLTLQPNPKNARKIFIQHLDTLQAGEKILQKLKALSTTKTQQSKTDS
ncbi:MAG: hypothetical protein ACP5IZ_11810, partial [Thermoprotei archaeon]